MPTLTVLVDGSIPVAEDFNGNFRRLNQALGTSTSITTYSVGDLVYASAADTLTRRAIGSTSQVLTVVGGLPAWADATATLGIPRGYLAGFTLATGTDTANDIDIAAGVARDDTNADSLLLASAITKRLDAAWAVGTAEGGLDTGSEQADTWYHLFAIKRPDTGVVDALFSASATSPTLPANYTLKRRLGAVRNDNSSNLLAFSQLGDEFLLRTPLLDVNSTNQGTNAVLQALTVPGGVKVWAVMNLRTSAVAVYLSAPDVTDQAASASGASPLSTAANAGAAMVHGPIRVRTDTSSQIRSRIAASGSGENFQIATLGWIDRRGQDD